jgi:hypothetical protein
LRQTTETIDTRGAMRPASYVQGSSQRVGVAPCGAAVLLGAGAVRSGRPVPIDHVSRRRRGIMAGWRTGLARPPAARSPQVRTVRAAGTRLLFPRPGERSGRCGWWVGCTTAVHDCTDTDADASARKQYTVARWIVPCGGPCHVWMTSGTHRCNATCCWLPRKGRRARWSAPRQAGHRTGATEKLFFVAGAYYRY